MAKRSWTCPVCGAKLLVVSTFKGSGGQRHRAYRCEREACPFETTSSQGPETFSEQPKELAESAPT